MSKKKKFACFFGSLVVAFLFLCFGLFCLCNVSRASGGVARLFEG